MMLVKKLEHILIDEASVGTDGISNVFIVLYGVLLDTVHCIFDFIPG